MLILFRIVQKNVSQNQEKPFPLTCMRSRVCRQMMLQQESLSALLASIRTFFIVAWIILPTFLNYWLRIFRGLKVLQVFSDVRLLHWRLKVIATYNDFNCLQLWWTAHVWLHFAMSQLSALLLFTVFQCLQNFLDLNWNCWEWKVDSKNIEGDFEGNLRALCWSVVVMVWLWLPAWTAATAHFIRISLHSSAVSWREPMGLMKCVVLSVVV